jgi:hypothetical protein
MTILDYSPSCRRHTPLAINLKFAISWTCILTLPTTMLLPLAQSTESVTIGHWILFSGRFFPDMAASDDCVSEAPADIHKFCPTEESGDVITSLRSVLLLLCLRSPVDSKVALARSLGLYRFAFFMHTPGREDIGKVNSLQHPWHSKAGFTGNRCKMRYRSYSDGQRSW